MTEVHVKSPGEEESKQKEQPVQGPEEEELGPFVPVEVRLQEGSYQEEWSMRWGYRVGHWWLFLTANKFYEQIYRHLKARKDS